MNLIKTIRNKITLHCWSGVKIVGKHKRIRLSRTYESYHKSVVDLTWSMREVLPDGKQSKPSVISERVSNVNLRRVISHYERQVVPHALERFAQKIGETL